MHTVHNKCSRLASRGVSKAVTLLFRAGKELEAASRNAPDRYNADRLKFLALGVREVTLPLHRLASHLEKGGLR